MIPYSFLTERALSLAYMPFVHGGGLFIQWKAQSIQFGDEVKLAITLPNDTIVYETPGKVVWLSPMDSGYGMALLGEAGERLKHRIETCLREKKYDHTR